MRVLGQDPRGADLQMPGCNLEMDRHEVASINIGKRRLEGVRGGRRRKTRMRGFPHSGEPEASMGVELWVGVIQGGWSPVIWISMKGVLRAVRPREEGLVFTEPSETRTPIVSSISTLRVRGQ